MQTCNFDVGVHDLNFQSISTIYKWHPLSFTKIDLMISFQHLRLIECMNLEIGMLHANANENVRKPFIIKGYVFLRYLYISNNLFE